MVSSIPPRYGINIDPLNYMLDEMCNKFNLQFIDHSGQFYYTNGHVKFHLFLQDGIHLSKKGTSVLLKSINQYVSILRHRTENNWYCLFCGESGHNSSTCRHGQKVLCYSCNNYGHKEKFCSLYS